MPDVAWTDSPPAPQAPPPNTGYDPRIPDTGAGAAFQQALQDADPSDDSDPQADEGGDGDGETPSTDRRRGSGDGSGLGGALAALVGGAPHHAQALRGRGGTEGRQGALGGLGASTSEGPQLQPARAGGVDLDAFADLLDRAAAQAPLSAIQTFQLALGDPRAPVNSVSMTRLPDGTLSMTLGADNEAVTEVRAALESLRRRLEARGVPIAALTAEGANAGVERQDAT